MILAGCGTHSSPSFDTVVKAFVASPPSVQHLRLMEGSKPLVAGSDRVYQTFKPFNGYWAYYDGVNSSVGPDHVLTVMVGTLFSPAQVSAIVHGATSCNVIVRYGEKLRACASAESVSPGSLHPLIQIDKLGKS